MDEDVTLDLLGRCDSRFTSQVLDWEIGWTSHAETRVAPSGDLLGRNLRDLFP
jgi:hypothetical protein